MPAKMHIRVRPVLQILLAILLLGTWSSWTHAPVLASDTDITATAVPFSAPEPDQPCSGAFVTHYLPHFTASGDGVIRMFQANGSGLATGDLDGDGDLDLVVGSLYGPDSIFWNEGGLDFRRQHFGDGNTRAITLVDVDGDGLLDIVLTRATGSIGYWHNEGSGRFASALLPGVARPASVLNWADLDQDGDLDLVTASYDAGLLIDRGSTFLMDGGGGVVYYQNEGGRFVPTVLEPEAQALAVAVQDINGDGLGDIMVANDFAMPDFVWLSSEDGWLQTSPFTVTSHSTMSIDFGDVNNDGALDVFTTDMKPFAGDASTLAAWAPAMSGMEAETHTADDPQHMENVLQIAGAGGEFANRAPEWGVDATGWSWSSRFGDLDSDGYLDLYVVNGMIEERMFAHLPRHELVERNQAFGNVEGASFEPAPQWELDSRYSGRGSVIADFDGDGDLDIAVNNLRGPVQIFENRLCAGDSIQVELHDLSAANRRGIGARIDLVTDTGVLTRDVRAASGYLSGDAPRVHFGVPPNATVERLDITWPDGARSSIEAPPINSLLTVKRMAAN